MVGAPSLSRIVPTPTLSGASSAPFTLVMTTLKVSFGSEMLSSTVGIRSKNERLPGLMVNVPFALSIGLVIGG